MEQRNSLSVDGEGVAKVCVWVGGCRGVGVGERGERGTGTRFLHLQHRNGQTLIAMH